MLRIQESSNAGVSYTVVANNSLNVPAGGIVLTNMSVHHIGVYPISGLSRIKITVASTLAFAASSLVLKFIRLSP